MGKKLTYKSSGVDIGKADKFINNIKPAIRSTKRSGVMGTIGGFGGLFKLPVNIKNPVLVGATDGVGTKLLIANSQKKHDTIGIDLVAMCVNDIIACGAEPLFFLDYLATGALNPKNAVDVVNGIAKGCKQANCAIIGGETAEMPGMYSKDDYDLAGFCVGIIDKKKIIDGKKVKNGDIIIGLASSGLHSNGFSLARKVFTEKDLKGEWGKKLLTPTTIYVKPVINLHKKGFVKAVAHITGGGFYENINRAIPKNKNAIIKKGSWSIPKIFNEIQKRGNIVFEEMYKTFNMGIGMVLIIDPKNIVATKKILSSHKIKSYEIGTITSGKNKVIIE